MVSSSKILTVSYGTFSCTAEGFDDPLAVVKDTTQFFRGVVGEDRFFGAEPPQFDPELATELMREQLGTAHGAGTVSLGRPAASSSGAMTAALSAGPARARAEAPDLPDDDTIEATAVITERPVAEDQDAPADGGLTATAPAYEAETVAPAPQPDPGLNAAPETGLRPDPEAPAPIPDQAADDGMTPAFDAADLAKTSQAMAAPMPAVATGVAPSGGMMDTLQTPVEAATPTEAPEAAALVEDAPAPRPSDPQGIAAKLDRIRAVVSGHGAPVAAMAAAAGPLTATAPAADAPAAFTPDDQGDVADEAALSATAGASPDMQWDETEEPLPSAAPASAAPDVQGDEVDEAALSALLDEMEDEDLGAQAQTVDAVEPEDGDDSLFADSIASLMAEEMSVADDGARDMASPAAAASAWDMDDDDARQPVESFDDAEVMQPVHPQEADLALAPEDEAVEGFDDGFDDEDLPVAPPVAEAPRPASVIRARVVKVKRADFEKAVASGSLEEVVDEPQTATGGSSLSDEEEEELARELAAVKAELSADFDAWDDEDDDEEEATAAATPRFDAAQDDASFDWDEEDDDEPDGEDRAGNDAFADDDLDDVDDEADEDRAALEDDAEDEDDFDARLTAAVARSAALPDDAQDAPAPLRLDNPVSRPDRDWGTDIDALDAKASAALGKGPVAEADDEEDDEDDTHLAIDEAVRDSARKAVKMASPARAMLTEREVADQDTSRLIDQTNSEMDEPEGNRRRSAIAHLRAAVAATKADRLLGRKAQSEDEEEAYREDLASVVRPRRPQAPSERTERPAQPAAPLKLVAEQRVAEEPAAPPQTVPIRPRRVRRMAEAPTSREVSPAQGYAGGTAGFASYAESVGAADLPDLLEAAAAYMSYVEGRDQFSRPQLMTTVRQAEVTESSREDRLRSFGQLLREGKIRKTTGGRFTASERISFRPDREAV